MMQNAHESAINPAPKSESDPHSDPLVSVLSNELRRLQVRVNEAGSSERDTLLRKIDDLDRGIRAVRPTSQVPRPHGFAE